MRASLLIATATLAVALPGAAAARQLAPPPVWEPGSHYTATLDQRAGSWRLHPADGQDLGVTVPATCGDAPPIPAGVWLLVHRDGGLALAAPSGVALPAGHAGEIAVRACGSDAGALHLPAPLLQLLAEHTGAVHVAD